MVVRRDCPASPQVLPSSRYQAPASLHKVNRILLLLLPVAMLLSGCAQLMGTSNWDRIEVTYSAAASDPDGGYTLTLTPAEASYSVGGRRQTTELPQGTWDAAVTAVRALGQREGQPCADAQTIEITAKAAGRVSQTFAATSCEAGEVFNQAKQLVDMILQRIT